MVRDFNWICTCSVYFFYLGKHLVQIFNHHLSLSKHGFRALPNHLNPINNLRVETFSQFWIDPQNDLEMTLKRPWNDSEMMIILWSEHFLCHQVWPLVTIQIFNQFQHDKFQCSIACHCLTLVWIILRSFWGQPKLKSFIIIIKDFEYDSILIFRYRQTKINWNFDWNIGSGKSRGFSKVF